MLISRCPPRGPVSLVPMLVVLLLAVVTLLQLVSPVCAAVRLHVPDSLSVGPLSAIVRQADPAGGRDAGAAAPAADGDAGAAAPPAGDQPAKKGDAKRGASAQDDPAQDAPSQDAPAQDAPAQDAPAQDAPAQDAPAQDAPAQDAPAQDAPAQPPSSGSGSGPLTASGVGKPPADSAPADPASQPVGNPPATGDATSPKSDSDAPPSDPAPAQPADPATPASNSTADAPKGDPADGDAAAAAPPTDGDGSATPPKDGSAAASAPESADPKLPFELLYVEEITEDSAGFKFISVYKDGNYTEEFADNPTNTALNTSDDDSKWFLHEDYTDRIAFQFRVDPNQKGYAIVAPTITTTAEAIIEPAVKDFRADSATGSFTVLYRCIPGKPGRARLAMHLPIGPGQVFETMWVKECGSGFFQYLRLTYVNHEDRQVDFNPDGSYGTEQRKVLEVGPLDPSTELRLSMKPPAQTLDFLDPHIESDNPDVGVSLRGAMMAGTITDAATSIHVLYTCNTNTQANVKFTLEIPPWDNITLPWRKDCGGEYSRALLIGTTGADSFDIMQEGKLSDSYNVSENSRVEDVKGTVENLPPDVRMKRFYITNHDDTSEIQFQTISLTFSNPDVLRANVYEPMGSRSAIPPGGDTIPRRSTKSLYLRFVCRTSGVTTVLVTLPTVRYKTVEFGFLKTCDEPRSYQESGFFRTAGSVLGSILFLAVVASIGGCYYVIKKRRGIKYAPVPTMELGA